MRKLNLMNWCILASAAGNIATAAILVLWLSGIIAMPIEGRVYVRDGAIDIYQSSLAKPIRVRVSN